MLEGMSGRNFLRKVVRSALFAFWSSNADTASVLFVFLGTDVAGIWYSACRHAGVIALLQLAGTAAPLLGCGGPTASTGERRMGPANLTTREMSSPSGRRDIRRRRVHGPDVRLELGGHRVLERAHGLLAALGVREDGELGVEERVRLAHGHAERDPVARGRDVPRVDAVRAQPRADGRLRVRGGRRERLNLIIRQLGAARGRDCAARTCSLESHSRKVGLPGVLACSSAFSRPAWSPMARLTRMLRTLSAGAGPACTNDSGAAARRSWTAHERTAAPYVSASRTEATTQNESSGETMVRCERTAWPASWRRCPTFYTGEAGDLAADGARGQHASEEAPREKARGFDAITEDRARV